LRIDTKVSMDALGLIGAFSGSARRREREGMRTQFSHVVDSLPELVWTAFPSGDIDFISRRWCEYTKLNVEAAYGEGWQATIHPADLSQWLDRWRYIVTSHEAGEMEARLRRFDGAYRWFLFRVSPVFDASGQLVKWCGVSTDIEERRLAEDAVRSRMRRFRLIVDGLPTLVTTMLPEGGLDYANRTVLEYFGGTLDELRSLTPADSFHPDDRAAALLAWKESLESARPYDFEGRQRRADGAYRWFRMRGFPLQDADGRVALWYFLQTDVEEQKRAEALLEGEKRLLEMVVSGAPLHLVLNALCRIVEANLSGCRCSVVLIDSTRAYIENVAAPSLPASFSEAIHGRPLNTESGPCAMAAYLNEQVIAADITQETRWESYAWCPLALAHDLKACWSTPIVARSGDVLGAFALYWSEPTLPTREDQTLISQVTHIASVAIERTRNDEALKRSEAFLAEAQNLSLTGSFSWRAATNEILWSPQTYRIFELDPAVPLTIELVGSRTHPDDVPALLEFVERARRDGCDCEYDHRLQMPGGSIKYVHTVAHAMRGHDGQLEYIGAIQDVTEHRLSEQALSKVRTELIHAARVTSLGALAASIAHEVNQPLSGIVTNASTCLRMLGANPPNFDGARETVRRTLRDGERASNVIDRLRSLFGKKETASESVNLNEATREVIALSLSELQRVRVVLRTELSEDLPHVIGDRVQLQQVIMNLLRNASDAMSGVEDRPRQLVVRSEPEGDGLVRLTVRDTGAGFDPQDADRLFEAFYTTKSAGMGIGLSVCRSIVESHRGRLWASTNDGPGATFSFSIPHAGKSAATVQSAPVDREEARPRGQRTSRESPP
jgi:PAS domain S-box-containing protein